MTHTDASAEPATAALSRHVPALDGMRAICVVGVLMYHAQLGGADAGFLGVSQFFTLSGFLVMSILLRSLERDDLNPVTFWSRRYRRLLPASLLTLLGVVVFGFTLATEQQLDDLVTSIPAALLQVANWHFVATDTSYVQLFQAPSPVQHFWSLAVEEQFYLLIPLVLLGIRAITTSTKIIAAVIAGLTVASTAWMWWLFDGGASIDRLYYGTDTRAAEILVGCVLALILSARRGTLCPRQRQVLGGGTVLLETLDFRCGEATEELRCGAWSAWADAIDLHEPDIVLLHVTIWPALTEDAEWVEFSLNQGLDRLTADGATVVWGRDLLPGFFDGADDPFLQAMNNVAAVRPDVRVLTGAVDGSKLLDEIENYARTANDDADRVLIIGDSVSRTIGYGLEQTTANDNTVIVWSAGIEGCGILHEGFITDSTGRETVSSDVCANIEETWSSQLEAFRPDRVIVSSTVFDFRERRLDEWDAPLEPGDAAFDDYLIAQYLKLYDLLDAAGAEVTWIEPPCALDIFGVLTEPGSGSAVSAERVAYARSTLLPRLVDERPGIRLFDLYAIMCPNDEILTSADGVDDVRPDGVHFGVEGSLWLAVNHGDELLMATDR